MRRNGHHLDVPRMNRREKPFCSLSRATWLSSWHGNLVFLLKPSLIFFYLYLFIFIFIVDVWFHMPNEQERRKSCLSPSGDNKMAVKIQQACFGIVVIIKANPPWEACPEVELVLFLSLEIPGGVPYTSLCGCLFPPNQQQLSSWQSNWVTNLPWMNYFTKLWVENKWK